MAVKVKSPKKTSKKNSSKLRKIKRSAATRGRSLERLSLKDLRSLIRRATISALRQNSRAGVSTIAAEKGSLVWVNPDGTTTFIRKIPTSLSIPKGKYKVVKK